MITGADVPSIATDAAKRSLSFALISPFTGTRNAAISPSAALLECPDTGYYSYSQVLLW